MCTLFVGQLAFAGQLAAQWTPEAGLRMPEGFQLTPLYKVPGEQGSWVSLTTDPQGRLIASDQYGKLYRITLDAAGNLARVQAIQVDIGRAHGLLCAFGALYVMAHQGDGKPSGLYRVTDTNNNDEYDKVELLREIGGEGEHGPHAITLSPDGKSLYICAGNHTQLPEISDSPDASLSCDQRQRIRLAEWLGQVANLLPGLPATSHRHWHGFADGRRLWDRGQVSREVSACPLHC